MGRILVVLLGIAVVLGTAWYAAKGNRDGRDAEGAADSSRTLQNVREAAHRIEGDAQKHADDLFEKTGEAAPEQR